MTTYCRPILKVNVADIDTGMVLRCIEGDWKRAPETMDRVRRRIGEVLGFCQVRNLRPAGALPTAWENHLDKLLPHPRSIQPVKHHPAMAYADVPALYAKLSASDAIADACLALVLLTAVRSVEAREAQWNEIDFAARTWTIPASRMKKKLAHVVPLSDEAMALIERLPRKGEHLFAINGDDKPLVAMTLRKTLARHAGEGYTIHGFRASFRTWSDECSNYPERIKEFCLAHVESNATVKAYMRSDLLAQRAKLMVQWASYLASPPAVDATSVVPLYKVA